MVTAAGFAVNAATSRPAGVCAVADKSTDSKSRAWDISPRATLETESINCQLLSLTIGCIVMKHMRTVGEAIFHSAF